MFKGDLFGPTKCRIKFQKGGFGCINSDDGRDNFVCAGAALTQWNTPPPISVQPFTHTHPTDTYRRRLQALDRPHEIRPTLKHEANVHRQQSGNASEPNIATKHPHLFNHIKPLQPVQSIAPNCKTFLDWGLHQYLHFVPQPFFAIVNELKWSICCNRQCARIKTMLVNCNEI